MGDDTSKTAGEVEVVISNQDRIQQLVDRARKFISQSRSENTIIGYRSDWKHFVAWCKANNRDSLPAQPETVALYVADLSTSYKASTLSRRMSSISQAHQTAGLDSPTWNRRVKALMSGMWRTKGQDQRSKTPILLENLKQMLSQLPNNLAGSRDRALLLTGFSGAFRRSELVAINVEDLEFTQNGLVVLIRRSKTDQQGEGRKVGIPHGQTPETCPVSAVRSWLAAAGIVEGPVFRPINRHGRKVRPTRLTGQSVAIVVKQYAGKLGLDAKDFGGHSLRSGLATSAAMAGASERSIMDQTGHRSLKTVRKYIRDGSLFRDNAAGKVGL